MTPSFNQGNYIEKTICSVINQNYNNFEYFIIDGGSTDNTIEIIKKYESKLTFWESTSDNGQSDAIKKGFSQSSGEILCWINSDDTYCQGTFRRVATFFNNNPELSFLTGDVNYIDERGNFIERIFSISPNWKMAANYGIHRWPQPACFWRKHDYFSVGEIDSNFEFAMDMDLFIRLAKYGKSKRLPGKPLANFRVHKESKSSKIPEIGLIELDKIIEKYETNNNSLQSFLLKSYWWLYCKFSSLRRFGSICFQIEI